MSAAVLGKRSLLEDLYSSPPLSKRGRCCGGTSSPPARFCAPAPDDLGTLRQIFPAMDGTILQKVLESCGNDINAAIRSLNELRLGSNDGEADSECAARAEPDTAACAQDAGNPAETTASSSACRENSAQRQQQEQPPAQQQPSQQQQQQQQQQQAAPFDPANMGAEDWVELVVREMMTSADLDDARGRAARVLETFEKAVQLRRAEGSPEAKEIATLREQVMKLSQDNHILKKAVTAYHSRQQEHEGRGRELQQLKQLLSQYQEQLRSLEVTNYALNLHLKTAQQASSIPGRFHPDVF